VTIDGANAISDLTVTENREEEKMQFSDHTLRILHQGEWNSQRHIATDDYRKLLLNAGYRPHTAALELLEQFGGLQFTFPSAKLTGYMVEFDFNLEQTLAVCDIDDIIDYGKCIGTVLCPVGEANNGHAILAVGDDAHVFAYFNPFISLLGHSFVEAIETLCLQKDPIKQLTYDGNPLVF